MSQYRPDRPGTVGRHRPFFPGMEKLDKSETLHRIAAKMRAEALMTRLPEYQGLMLRTAASLEMEADRLERTQGESSTATRLH
jgi:hypothetical protein